MGQEASFEELAAGLGSALKDVAAAKAAFDSAQEKATAARNLHTLAIAKAQNAHKAYQEHVSKAMSGFAQIHQ